ncbi:F-box domain-containing protein [Mycena sanguinolenta]|uniref:F-box domain-containing protein n=1 Tax=Mycena sanguinolenta TaxID=230812 RepID=A0A8H6ZEN6_9AGAR|nr:F-box domain-containing protein [Mycena sanguinolenta]
MSVEELRARIVTLDSEIERQKNLLEKLENDRILTLRQLNAALDPVARLPLEISSEIFLQSLTWGAQHAPTLLLKICSAWADIALTTPALWTSVHIHFPCDDDVAKVLPIWFERTRGRPLSISISTCGFSYNWNHRVFDVLWRHGGQLKHFEIVLLMGNDELGTYHPVDLFAKTTPLSLPLLETVTIRCQLPKRGYLEHWILDLLRRAPNIVEVVLDNVTALEDSGAQMLVVPTLRRLMFGDTTETDDEILRALALPALEALSLPMRYISGDNLMAFIERSAAPLQDLALGWEYNILQSAQLHDCLRLIPTLTRFKMWHPSSEVIAELFTALADSPSLLPNLHNLTIHILDMDHSPAEISYVSWRTLVRALSTRRVEHLYIVSVEVSPPTDVLASLRELIAHGASIHVGIEEANFLVEWLSNENQDQRGC